MGIEGLVKTDQILHCDCEWVMIWLIITVFRENQMFGEFNFLLFSPLSLQWSYVFSFTAKMKVSFTEHSTSLV